MNEYSEKRLIALASQNVRQHGIRAARMDVIARDMGVSKRTLYKRYYSKDNFIMVCLASYTERVRNLFCLLRMEASDLPQYLCALTKAFVGNLYKAEPAFWQDVKEHYPQIYETIWGTWVEELEKTVSECQEERWLDRGVAPKRYVQSLTDLFYHARMAALPSHSVFHLAGLLLRGSMTIEGISRLWKKKDGEMFGG